jgi:signal transduction histidine kinase
MICLKCFWGIGPWSRRSLLLLVSAVLLGCPNILAQAPIKKNVLILSDVGMSHPLTATITQQIVARVQEAPNRHVEFYYESLDLLAFPGRPSQEEARNWLEKKYGGHRLDVVVAVGPGAIDFLSNYAEALVPDVPIVISGSARGEVSNPNLDSRFTGTWLEFEPEKTLELALRLFPDTRDVFVVGGSSTFDETGITLTKEKLDSLKTNADIHYLTKMEMGNLLERLQQVPDHSIELYISFFQDAAGKTFLNATKALPMITEASNGPDFGVSDTYIGHGIVGGYVMTNGQQGNITAQIVTGLLNGKKAQEIPIETLPGEYIFDWHELQKWHIPESNLPSGSVVLFRERSLWERTKWEWGGAFVIILGLSTLVAYFRYSGKQLALARERQMQLSGMLIDAGEKERRRVALELHDDFSQRLALLALGLENAADEIQESPELAKEQLHKLLNSASEIGADLHTLSHGLHSSTLESLGLIPAIGALCKEVGAQHGLHVRFTSENIPNPVPADVALAMFRIVQEALRNVMKHSRATRAEVALRVIGNNIDVTVRDEGIGFDGKGLNGKGLGFRSMEERARLLSGRFEVHSEPGRGTRIEAWVPLNSRQG